MRFLRMGRHCAYPNAWQDKSRAACGLDPVPRTYQDMLLDMGKRRRRRNPERRTPEYGRAVVPQRRRSASRATRQAPRRSAEEDETAPSPSRSGPRSGRRSGPGPRRGVQVYDHLAMSARIHKTVRPREGARPELLRQVRQEFWVDDVVEHRNNRLRGSSRMHISSWLLMNSFFWPRSHPIIPACVVRSM
jgi:hypothetical protein